MGSDAARNLGVRSTPRRVVAKCSLVLSTSLTTSIGERSCSFCIVRARRTFTVASLTLSLAAICTAARSAAPYCRGVQQQPNPPSNI